ncbi:hypothetical protein [Bradyrhizobium yuanmingense]|uniref:hypothetical protein n=1 Tax=Bradyrhizobium yuanmingense TaxID=108015 RepID=UPI001FCF13BC|nr:hypothetical protein [Bradyrhizobium yuanmingense]
MKPKMCSVSKPASALVRAGASTIAHTITVQNLQALPPIPCPKGARRCDAAAALTGRQRNTLPQSTVEILRGKN